MKSTGKKGDPGILRVDYPGYSGEGTLEEITWDEWFKAFDANNLAFVYQPKGRSRFSKLIERPKAKKTAAAKRTARRAPVTKRATTTRSKKSSSSSSVKRRARRGTSS